MKNYPLSDEKAGLVVTALRATAFLSRDAGHDAQAKLYHDIADEIETALHAKAPETGGLVCGNFVPKGG